MFQKVITLFILLCTSLLCKAQVTDSLKHNVPIRLLIGYSLGKYSYAEVGIAKLKSELQGYHLFSSAYVVATEILIANKLVIGPKIGVWASGGTSGLAMGLNMIYYTNFKNGIFVFRPEIGIGVNSVKVVYGYNMRLQQKVFDKVNKNIVGFAFCVK